MPTTATLAFSQAKLEPAIAPHLAVLGAYPLVSGTYTKGTVLGQVTASKKFAAYNDNNSDGTQTARSILAYDVVSDGTNHTIGAGTEWAQAYPTAPVYIGGYFRCEELTGLDANGVADFGHLVEGSTASGILRVE